MGFIKRHGFLLIPAVYWLIYLGVRLTYNGLTGEYTPDIIQSVRQDCVLIICSLLVFYFTFFRIEDSGGKLSGELILSIVGFHVVALFVSFLICLWQGAFLWDVIFRWQYGVSIFLLPFIPLFTLRVGD